MEWWQIVLIILASTVVGVLVGALVSYLIMFISGLGIFKRRQAALAGEQPEVAALGFDAKVAKSSWVASWPWLSRLRFGKKRGAGEPEEIALREATARFEGQPGSTAPDLLVGIDRSSQAAPEPEIGELPLGRRQDSEEPEPTVLRETTIPLEGQLGSPAPDLFEEVLNNHRIATEPWADQLQPFQTQMWEAHQGEVDKLPANLREELAQAYIDIRLANSIAWLSVEFGRRSPNLDESYKKLRTSIAERLGKIRPLINR
ncbi:hypothetical protein ACFLYR_07565 [Chloroflexota bacterium]